MVETLDRSFILGLNLVVGVGFGSISSYEFAQIFEVVSIVELELIAQDSHLHCNQ